MQLKKFQDESSLRLADFMKICYDENRRLTCKKCASCQFAARKWIDLSQPTFNDETTTTKMILARFELGEGNQNWCLLVYHQRSIGMPSQKMKYLIKKCSDICKFDFLIRTIAKKGSHQTKLISLVGGGGHVVSQKLFSSRKNHHGKATRSSLSTYLIQPGYFRWWIY